MKTLYTLLALGMLGTTGAAQQAERMQLPPVQPDITRATSMANVLTEIPEGGVETAYIRSSAVFQRWGGGARETKDYGAYCVITEMEDGTVYMSNPTAAALTGYFQGQRVGDTYVFEMPQYLAENEYTVYEFGRFVYNDLGGGSFEYVLDQDSQDIVYTILEDGNVMQDGDHTSILGLVTEEGDWYGYGEFEQNLVVAPNLEKVEIPGGLTVSDLTISYDVYQNYGVDTVSKLGYAVVSENKVYLKGVSDSYPEAWIEGSLDDGVVTFKGGQFLGIRGGHVDWFVAGEHYTQYDPDWGITDHMFRVQDEISFIYDADTHILTAVDEDAAFMNNSSLEVSYYTQAYWNITLSVTDAVTDLVPVSPVLDYVNVGTSYISIDFKLIDRNAQGEMLRSANMGCRFYNDNGLVTLDDSYTRNGDMSFIPWGFEGYDIYGYTDGWFALYWHDTAEDQNLWVVAVNVVDGVEYESEPTALLGMVGADKVEADAASIEYYDMQGRRVAGDAKGLVIVVETRADGSRLSRKAIMK